MKALWHRRPVFWSVLAGMTATAAPALATQAHGGLTGIYTHQLAHIFFILSMGILIYWLRQRHLVRQTGWRYIQYAALFFIFWSLDAFLVHLMDDQLEIIRTRRLAPWDIRIEAAFGNGWLPRVYYLTKLDHLLCVPALLFLYAGLRRLLHNPHPELGENGTL